MFTRSLLVFLALLVLLVVSGCTAVRFNQKARLGETPMRFDTAPLRGASMGKILSSREGAVGGFSGSGVGGCGCN